MCIKHQKMMVISVYRFPSIPSHRCNGWSLFSYTHAAKHDQLVYTHIAATLQLNEATVFQTLRKYKQHINGGGGGAGM